MTAAAVPYIMIAATVASTAVAAYSSYQSGVAQRNAARYNASLMERQAAQAREAAKIRAENYRKAAAARLAKMRASIYSSGVDMAGSPLLVMMESEKEAKLDELRVKYGGEIEASGLLGSAYLERARGSQAMTEAWLGVGASLLSGAGRTAGAWYDYGGGGRRYYSRD